MHATHTVSSRTWSSDQKVETSLTYRSASPRSPASSASSEPSAPPCETMGGSCGLFHTYEIRGGGWAVPHLPRGEEREALRVDTEAFRRWRAFLAALGLTRRAGGIGSVMRARVACTLSLGTLALLIVMRLTDSSLALTWA